MSLVIDTEYPAGVYEIITIATGQHTLTAKYVSPAGEGENKLCREVFMTLEDNDIRYTLDGTAVATNTGHKLASGGSLTLKNPNDIKNFKATQISAAGKLHVTYRY